MEWIKGQGKLGWEAAHKGKCHEEDTNCSAKGWFQCYSVTTYPNAFDNGVTWCLHLISFSMVH